MNNLDTINIETIKTTLQTQNVDKKSQEDILFMEYIQTQDDEDDELFKELIDSLDSIDDKDIKNNKKIKSIQDIQDECEENNQHFHITKEQFDDIYNTQFASYQDEYNNVYDNILILKRIIKRKMFVNIQDIMLGNNVRGGVYSSPFNKLPDFSNITIDEIKDKLLNKKLK